jgi:hypothetical protein
MLSSRAGPRLLVAAAMVFTPYAIVRAARGPQAPVRQPARWPDKSAIRVWVSPVGMPAGGKDLVLRAVATWTTAAAGLITLAPAATEAGGQVRVRFVDARARYGETAPRLDHSGRIASADIAIAASVEGDPLDRAIVVYLTALHELGHAIGLPHTDRFDDIMYAFRLPGDGERYFARYRSLVSTIADIGSSRASGLSPADLRALRTLYGR